MKPIEDCVAGRISPKVAIAQLCCMDPPSGAWNWSSVGGSTLT